MNHQQRCDLGRIYKQCEEKRIEVKVDKHNKVVAMKGYCKAKDFRRQR